MIFLYHEIGTYLLQNSKKIQGKEELRVEMEKITDKNRIIEIMDRPTHIDARNEGFRIHGEGKYPTSLTMVGEDAILLYEYDG